MPDMIVTVNQKVLLGFVTTNMEKHQREYHEARAGYADKLNTELSQILTDLQLGKDVYDRLRKVALMPKPRSYAAEYQRVVRMLELHTGETVSLSEEQYQNYVEDDWRWSGDFMSGTAPYKK